MPKLLITGTYTADGAKALAKEGGSKRKAAVDKLVRSLGGKVEAFYFALSSSSSLYAVIDVPDATSGAALAIAVNASGMVKINVVTLLTPEEIDVACKTPVSYRAPGKK